jgi:hypothetical protein
LSFWLYQKLEKKKKEKKKEEQRKQHWKLKFNLKNTKRRKELHVHFD